MRRLRGRSVLALLLAAGALVSCKGFGHAPRDGGDGGGEDAGGGDGVGDMAPTADAVPDADAAPAPACPEGQHACGGTCVSNDDVRTCGVSCTPCLAPGGDGIATCEGGVSCGGACTGGKKLCNGTCIAGDASCVGTCPAGRHACGGLCPSNQDVNSCGASCAPCPVPAGASRRRATARGAASCARPACTPAAAPARRMTMPARVGKAA
jgi:hypothetical protein